MKTNAVPFSEPSIGPGLVLSANDTIVQTSQNVDPHRIARSQYGIVDPTVSARLEFYIYSPDGSNPSLIPSGGIPPLCVGFCVGRASLSKYLGEDLYGLSYCPGDGTVRHNGSVVATFAAAAYNQVIGAVLDMVNQTMTFSQGYTVLGSINFGAFVTAGDPIFYAATVSGSPGAMAVNANAGQTPLRYSTGGFYHLKPGITPLYLATEGYITASTDSRPNQVYTPNIDRQDQPIQIPRVCSKPWPFGSSMPSTLGGGQVQVLVKDPNYQINTLLTQDFRDQVIQFDNVQAGQAYSTRDSVFTGVIDRVTPNTDQTRTIYAGDKRLLLQQQLIRPLFFPNVDTAFAGKPYPFVAGIVRTMVAAQYNSASLIGQLTDAPIAAFGKVLSQGVEIAYGIDYVVLADGASIQLTQAPPGKVTFDFTTYGGAFNPTLADLLAGGGQFGSIANDGGGGGVNQPHGWTAAGGYGSLDAANTVFQVRGSSPNKYIEQSQKADAIYWAEFPALNIGPGEIVAYEIVVKQAPYFGPGVDALGQPITISPAKIYFCGMPDFNGQFYRWGDFEVPQPQNYSGGPTPSPVTYRGSFINTSTQTLPFVLGLACNNMIQGTGGITSAWQFDSITLVQLPSLLANVPLDGPGLDWLYQACTITHGPWEQSDYDATGAQAIDAATKYVGGVAYHSSETPMCQAAKQKVLDSWGAMDYPTRNGKISIFRLEAPEDASSVAGTLFAYDVLDYLICTPDNAEGLSTRLSGGYQPDPYSESDFANVTQSDVPQQVRKLLEQPYQWTATSSVPLAEKYQYAETVSPLLSVFDVEADGQAEITRMCSLYTKERHFYVGTFKVDSFAPFEIGQVWRVVYPLPTLNDPTQPPLAIYNGTGYSGQQLLLLAVTDIPSEGKAILTFWGL